MELQGRPQQTIETHTFIGNMETQRVPLMLQLPKAVCETAPFLEPKLPENCLAKIKLLAKSKSGSKKQFCFLIRNCYAIYQSQNWPKTARQFFAPSKRKNWPKTAFDRKLLGSFVADQKQKLTKNCFWSKTASSFWEQKMTKTAFGRKLLGSFLADQKQKLTENCFWSKTVGSFFCRPKAKTDQKLLLVKNC